MPAATASCSDRVRDMRPARSAGFEVRFETPPGEQAQVDFAQVRGRVRRRARRQAHRLAVLDGARLLPADLGALRPPPGSAERPALPYRRSRGDRRRAADDPLRSHEDRGHRRGRRRARRLQPRPCRPRPSLRLPAARLPALSGQKRRARSSGRSATSARTSSSAASFRNLEDLNDQLRHWLETVANPRVHATTQRVVNEAFAEEKAALKPLPLAPIGRCSASSGGLPTKAW